MLISKKQKVQFGQGMDINAVSGKRSRFGPVNRRRGLLLPSHGDEEELERWSSRTGEDLNLA